MESLPNFDFNIKNDNLSLQFFCTSPNLSEKVQTLVLTFKFIRTF